MPTKRVCLGGRGREWAAESLKLLEAMVVSDDAKLFLEPMNPLRYPVSAAPASGFLVASDF